MHTIQSLIERIKASRQYSLTVVDARLCPENVKSALSSIGIKAYSDVAYLLNTDDADRLLNILEALE